VDASGSMHAAGVTVEFDKSIIQVQENMWRSTWVANPLLLLTWAI
jgi:hypothetical protein